MVIPILASHAHRPIVYHVPINLIIAPHAFPRKPLTLSNLAARTAVQPLAHVELMQKVYHSRLS